MNKFSLSALTLGVTLSLSACATLVPERPAVTPDLPQTWPTTPEHGAAPDAMPPPGGTPVSDIQWQVFLSEPRLQSLIGQALDNNRDLRVAILNVQRARAQYRIQRADRVPALAASGTLTRTGGDAPVTDEYVAQLGIAEFELDLFGRVHNLSQAALQQYFATESTQHSARLSLIAEVTRAWLQLAADLESQRIAQATLESHETGFRLTQRRHQLGAVSGLDVAQARTVVETVRSDTARYAGLIAQDINALRLLVGGPLDPALLPERFTPDVSGVTALPAGLPSDVLLNRPDVRAAEYRLLAANANIGAARAAFFPSIRLTAGIGSISPELSGLFDDGTGFWSIMPRITLPIFQGGRLRAALGVATADRDIALADYERSIQTGFREVADALALSATLAQQVQAQEALVEAAARAQELSEARYRAGRDSYLNLLDAQRTLYSARQSLVATQLAEQNNRITLYRVLGGGWKHLAQE